MPVDGETRTSRVIGSVDFCRPTLSSEEKLTDDALQVLTGVRCRMPFTLKSKDASPEEMETIASEVFDIVESKLSNFNPHSEVNAVNNLPDNTPVAISEPMKEVLLCAKDMIKMTRGAFDPSAAALVSSGI